MPSDHADPQGTGTDRRCFRCGEVHLANTQAKGRILSDAARQAFNTADLT
jgi:hypothetical protein